MNDDLTAASSALTRMGGSTTRALEDAQATTIPGTSAPSGDPGRQSVFALVLLGLSGLTAGIALLTAVAARAGQDRAAVSFVERHRLGLAGISTSCLLAALLVFAGLI